MAVLDWSSEPPAKRDRIDELSLEEIGLFGITPSKSSSSVGPELGRDRERIYLGLLPPRSFIAGRMILAMVDGTEGDGKLIAYLECKPSLLRVTHMMGVGGGAAADQARLTRYKAQVLF